MKTKIPFVLALLLVSTSSASFGATVLYAETIKGLIYKSTDSAKTWQQLPPINAPGVAAAALAVDPQNTNNLYSIYDPGKLPPGSTARIGVFRSTDGGQKWVETLVQASPPIAVDATASSDWFRRLRWMVRRPTANRRLRLPTVTIGGASAMVTFSGLAPGFVGLNQFNVMVPSGLASGNQPVVMNVGGVNSNSVLLPVR